MIASPYRRKGAGQIGFVEPSPHGSRFGGQSVSQILKILRFKRWMQNAKKTGAYLRLDLTFLIFLLWNCFLCLDCWNGDVTPTLDEALLCSSRAGSDLGRVSR